MAASRHYQAITKLGKKIVEELFTKENYQLTRNWMSQYVAELMSKVEIEEDEKSRKVLQKECQDAILKLWEHRNAIPGGSKPLGNLQDTIAIIQALVKDESEPFHWRRYSYDDSIWGQFMHSINDAIEDILKIAICSSISDELFKKEKEWLEHLKFLSKDERRILEYLDALLYKTDSGIRLNIIIQGEDVKPEVEPADKFTMIINKLQALIDSQQKALDKLKNQFTHR